MLLSIPPITLSGLKKATYNQLYQSIGSECPGAMLWSARQRVSTLTDHKIIDQLYSTLETFNAKHTGSTHMADDPVSLRFFVTIKEFTKLYSSVERLSTPGGSPVLGEDT